MARVNRPFYCRSCQKITQPPYSVSWRGLCQDCAQARMRANNIQLSEHRGPYFERWRERSLAALGVFAVDDSSGTG
jgi:hypothetical protein